MPNNPLTPPRKANTSSDALGLGSAGVLSRTYTAPMHPRVAALPHCRRDKPSDLRRSRQLHRPNPPAQSLPASCKQLARSKRTRQKPRITSRGLRLLRASAPWVYGRLLVHTGRMAHTHATDEYHYNSKSMHNVLPSSHLVLSTRTHTGHTVHSPRSVPETPASYILHITIPVT